MFFNFLVLGMLAVLTAGGSDHSSTDQLDYQGVDEWGGLCNSPRSRAQSPIDIRDCESVERNGDNKNMVDHLRGVASLRMKNGNNPNTIKYEIKGKNFVVPWVSDRKVKLLQLHIHWGSNNQEGSEHLVEGRQFAAEAHLVTSYKAEDGTQKLMVFARLFTVLKGERGNDQMEQIIKASEETCHHDESSHHGDHGHAKERMCRKRNLKKFNLAKLYPADPGAWYSYPGSLTTPDCNEIVHWVVVMEPLLVSDNQMERLRTLKLGDGSLDPLSANWRVAQDTNDRQCHFYQ